MPVSGRSKSKRDSASIRAKHIEAAVHLRAVALPVLPREDFVPTSSPMATA